MKIVMECVYTPTFSLMINGELHGYFALERGMRQDDPLSPLLFVICMEYLARILRKMSEIEQYHVHLRCISLKHTHLSFDDR